MNSKSPAGKRYMSRFIPFMVGYVVTIFGATWLVNNNPPEGALLYAVAVAPALCILGVIWAMGMYMVEETDEYVRMRLVRASLVATGITLAAATVWGFLETYAGVPHVPAWIAFVVWCGSLGLAQCWYTVTDK